MNNTDLATAKENSPLGDHMRISRLDDSLFSKELAPHYMSLASKLASSELVPKSFRGKPQDLFLCWALGYQIGMSPEQAMQCIAIINGRACMWGDEMLALCMAHPDFADITEVPVTGSDGKILGYVCTIKRKGRTPTVSEFTLEMAKKAGLWGKQGVWSQYPERMLKLRARGFALRDAFPDALKGIKSREEVEDYIDAEYTVSKPSRTEVIKEQLIKGVDCVDAIGGFVAGKEDSQIGQEVEPSDGSRPVATSSEETTEMHSKIKQLIEEGGLTSERVAKALKFYKVNSIEELDAEACNHFLLKLTNQG